MHGPLPDPSFLIDFPKPSHPRVCNLEVIGPPTQAIGQELQIGLAFLHPGRYSLSEGELCMTKNFGLGTVFAAEWLAVSRRWQWYAARSVLVSCLLGSMAVVWWARAAGKPSQSVQALAEVGRLFCGAMTATLLAIVLLGAPASTAGAICIDRARGTLIHMLVTDLSSAEIVLGKLTARMVPVLGLLLCILPIPALGSWLGGIDPWMVGGATLVTLAVAVTGCAAALALSTWGTKTHEVLLTTYAGWALWLLALPMWWGYRLVIRGGMPPPGWFEKANPIWLVAAPYVRPGAVGPGDLLAYFGASLLASAAMIGLAVTHLRCAGARKEGRPYPEIRLLRPARLLDRLLGWVPSPSLDANPVLWREWHRRRPSRWALAVWSLYGAMTMGLSLALIAMTLTGVGAVRQVASVGNGFQAGIGLLLLSVSAATVLAEERVGGNLDILLATPLSTRSIVWGKWWGTFRGVPLLAIGPGAVAIALARESGRWEGVALIVGLFLAYGAAVTSLGLALATWMHRLDHAVAVNVAMLGGVTVGWLFAVVVTIHGPGALGAAAGSPIIGIMFPTIGMQVCSPGEWEMVIAWWGLWIGVYAVIAVSLGWATLMTFDRCLSRIPDSP
jgi:ABC-type transport system involved in multi-copper enzyme maturation permease subunit